MTPASDENLKWDSGRQGWDERTIVEEDLVAVTWQLKPHRRKCKKTPADRKDLGQRKSWTY